jgi:hypothetical protein
MNPFTTSKVLSYLALIFLAGGATGAVLTLKSTQPRQLQAPTMEKACTRLQDRLVSKLGLTPDQVRELQPVFDQTAQQLRNVHAQAIRDTDAIIHKAHEQISLQLTPEQKARLSVLDEEREEWVHRRLKDCAPKGVTPP